MPTAGPTENPARWQEAFESLMGRVCRSVRPGRTSVAGPRSDSGAGHEQDVGWPDRQAAQVQRLRRVLRPP
ncbi:hypothetical protein GCM10022220_48410 [Actinocatenispora rupis]|uniref:Uncharacterized protein n=1 Tax=Actinocatenispora rupis TaxID=519421 RepID=A0A8J3NAR7_9ACTN|nr:hypothetical protein Aru02nite_32700 [Actinocatenispora rupis]